MPSVPQRPSLVLFVLAAVFFGSFGLPVASAEEPLQISGIYPHLTVYNTPIGTKPRSDHGECGIGAVVPWAGKLWMITYPPHKRSGSQDLLYEVTPDLKITERPESVGGTHANRLIHRESEQLIIGPHFIDKNGKVRTCDLSKLNGRMTATARHLTDPANMVYFYDMEGTVYEVNVHTLAVTKLFDKPVPGWHGKGAYTGGGRFIVSNNGEHASGERSYRTLKAGGKPESEEDAGVLAEWDGETWQIVERRQFTDVTGPGGIEGNSSKDEPVWAMGWDRRSVILKMLDEGSWHTFRLPKGSHTFDPYHGWFTEWPRIREAAPGVGLMVMHGTMFQFPMDFSAQSTEGIRPLATHLRYIPDFCHWNNRLVLAADDTSVMGNALAGQPQSNLWFGSLDDLPTFGPRSGWGGVWLGDTLNEGAVSDPFLISGYDKRTVHFAINSSEPITFTLEVDPQGDASWTKLYDVVVEPGYEYNILPPDLDATWLRVRCGGHGIVSCYLHLASDRPKIENEGAMFAGLADVNMPGAYSAGTIRPSGHNRSLQFLARNVNAEGEASAPTYYEVELQDNDIVFAKPDEDHSSEMEKLASIEDPFTVDAASVIVKAADGKRYRLPKGSAVYDEPFAAGWARGAREAVSERWLANWHGTFYEIPRAGHHGLDIERIKPVASHNKLIQDYCTWRGLFVISGVRAAAERDGHVFGTEGGPALWFGHIDDLWRLGKPVGQGGPWKDSAVKAGETSEPYLMTGYDQKELSLSHDVQQPVTFRVLIDFDHRFSSRLYKSITVQPGETVRHRFPDGFQAHWLRLEADHTCHATGWLTYR